MNLVVLMGRLTADPEIRYTRDGKPVARFTLAVNRYSNGKQEADFFNCSAFGKSAENIERLHISKGTKLLVSGQIHNDNYQAQDGTKRYAVNIVISSFEFCEKKGADAPTPTPAPTPAPVFTPPADLPDNFMIPDNIDEELPFA